MKPGKGKGSSAISGVANRNTTKNEQISSGKVIRDNWLARSRCTILTKRSPQLNAPTRSGKSIIVHDTSRFSSGSVCSFLRYTSCNGKERERETERGERAYGSFYSANPTNRYRGTQLIRTHFLRME